MSDDRFLLVRLIRDPSSARSLSLSQWDAAIRQAKASMLTARLAVLLDDAGLMDAVPPQPRVHLASARVEADKHTSTLRWEVNRAMRALSGTSIRVVLLKGGAYVIAGLPGARGRVVADLDIMVDHEHLPRVEQALQMHGWEATKLDPYDQHYYRQWMHEIPPMRHRSRLTVIDVHHNILPRTDRLCPDPAKLWARVEAIPALPGVYTLGAEDMVLHSSVHLFLDGEFEHGLRDIVDIDQMLRHFAQRGSAFWESLIARAEELGLRRPLHYALRYAVELMGTPIPPGVRTDVGRGGPSRWMQSRMDALFGRALLPAHASCDDAWTGAARTVLLARAHWLKMPPHVLVPHLIRKTMRRALPKGDEPAHRPLMVPKK